MEYWLPVIFAGLMALSMLIYVVLDGYDLGVGILLNGAGNREKDLMIASIGPFWDANETWLVLGVGLLLIAFPMAHGEILTSLYLPVAAMLVGLILRGHYVTGFETTPVAYGFALLIGICLLAGYALLGATWLIMKSEGELQLKAVTWARYALWLTALGIAAVSIMTPLVSSRVVEKWFSFPQFIFLSQIPAVSAALVLTSHFRLKKLAHNGVEGAWIPFAMTVALFVLAFAGLGYSLFPYLIIDRITIWDAAAATESLSFIRWGVVISLPAILAYTVFAYRARPGSSATIDGARRPESRLSFCAGAGIFPA